MRVEGRGIFLDFTLDTPDGEKTYSIPAAGISEGMRLAEIWTMKPEQRNKLKMNNVELFKLALGDTWRQLEADRAPYSDAWRVGMAALAREQVLFSDPGPDRWANSIAAARGIVEAGVDPEALAAWAAAQTKSGTGSTNRATRRAAAATTRSTKRGTGTRTKPATTSRKASRSRGSGSAASGR